MNKIKKNVISKIEKTQIGNRALHNVRYRTVFIAFISLIINIAYAFYNGILGIMYASVWFLAMFAYYTLLSVMRFSAVLYEYKTKKHNEKFIMRFIGVMLIIMSLVLSASVYYSIVNDVANKNNEIVMITIATYTFYKIIMAIINLAKIKKYKSFLLITIRNIALADVAVSIFSLQRPMLVSFEGMTSENIRIMNICTGSGVCLLVLVLGIIMSVGLNKKNIN